MAKTIWEQKQSLSKAKMEEMIRQKAWEICQKRGCAPGNEWADWFEAERIVKRQINIR
jgi:hypothetical protein